MIDIPVNASNLTKKKKIDIDKEISLLGLDAKNLKLGAKIFILRNNLTFIPKCKNCNKELVYYTPSCSYRTYCSYKCSANSKDTQNKKRITNIKKYGTGNILTVKAEIAKKRVIEETYDSFIRFKDSVIPLFSKEEFIGKTARQIYKWHCIRCNNEFERKFVPSIQKWPKCPACDGEFTDIESVIQKFLLKNNINFKSHYRKILPNMELDFFIPEKQIAIETHGLYYHTERSFSKQYHKIKTDLCNEKGIKLIQIFSDEIDNTKACFGRLKSILGLNKSIAARKCNVKAISVTLYNKFLNKYHTQGTGKSVIRYGLFYKSRLVSVMSFCKLRNILGQKHKEDVWELARFATMYGITIIGGFQKLLATFITEYKPISITTYADVRWTPNPLKCIYSEAEFKYIHTSVPNYWYTNDHIKRLHRAGFQKHKLVEQYPEYSSLTENEIMKKIGYSRIWDCGNHKFELKIV
jgi:hypothetical protein